MHVQLHGVCSPAVRVVGSLKLVLTGTDTHCTYCHWHCVQRTQVWLERYVFKRLPRAYNEYGTYLLLSLWHGCYAGYGRSSVLLPSQSTGQQFISSHACLQSVAVGTLSQGICGCVDVYITTVCRGPSSSSLSFFLSSPHTSPPITTTLLRRRHFHFRHPSPHSPGFGRISWV